MQVTKLRLLGALDGTSSSPTQVEQALAAFSQRLGFASNCHMDGTQLWSRLDAVLKGRGLLDVFAASNGAGRRFVVAGIVQAHNQSVRVEALGLGLGGQESRLAADEVNDDGEFAITFTADTPPVFSLAVFVAQGEIYRTSPRLAQPEEWIEWSDTGAPVRRAGVFEAQQALLAAQLADGAQSLASLPALQACDVDVLAATTGLTAAVVHRHAVAQQFAAELAIPASAAYGLLASAALHATTSAEARRQLFGLSPRVLVGLLETAIERGEIGGALCARLSAIGDALAKAHAQFWLDEPYKGGSPWRTLLASAGVPPERTIAVTTVLLREGEAAGWKAVAGLIGAAVAEAAQSAVAIAALAGHDERIVAPLREHGLVSPRTLARRNKEELHTILSVAIPDSTDRSAVIDAIHNRADESYAADSLLRHCAASLSSATRAFLAQAGDAFDLDGAHVERLEAQGAFAKDPADNQTVAEELARLQRIVRVAGHGALASTLIQLGFHSAQEIAFTDRGAFVSRLKAAGVAPAEAEAAHGHAATRYRAALAIYLNLNRAARGPNLAVLPHASTTATPVAAATGPTSLPTYNYLFGSQDYCACEECSSVTSAAAYLVDQLLWLKSAPPPPTGSTAPYDLLRQRRPDLGQILLECNNSEVDVPHIDIVCELLEDMVAVSHSLTRIPPGSWQTTRTAEEVRAYPEHLNLTAYDLLRTSTNSFSLPFDLSLAEIRAYLEKKGSSRLEVIEAFGLASDKATPATEYFRLGDQETTLITTAQADATHQKSIWGFDAGTIELDLFLQQAPAPDVTRQQLSYDDLLVLLSTMFVAPKGDVTVQLKAGVTVDSCKASDRVLNLSVDALDRLHRLLRLARHSSWSLLELDELIRSLGAGTLDLNALEAMAAAATALRRLGLTARELGPFFRSFAADDAQPRSALAPPSVYRLIFLGHTDDDPLPAAYLGDTTTPVPLQGELPRLSALLGVLPGDLAELLGALGLTAGTVSFANLALLYRHARLAQALGIGLHELLHWKKLLGDPFASIDQLNGFAADYTLTTQAGLSATDVDAFTAPGSLPPPPDTSSLTADLGAIYAAAHDQLLAQTGSEPAPADILAQIINARSWQSAVMRWLKGDTRLGIALDALAQLSPGGAGALFDTTTTTNRDALLGTFWREWSLLMKLGATAANVATLIACPGVLDVVLQPSLVELKRALYFVALSRRAAKVDSLTSYLGQLPAGSSPVLASLLGDSLGLDPAIIGAVWATLFGASGPTTAALRDPAQSDAILACVDLVSRVGVSSDLLASLARSKPTPDLSRALRAALRAGMSTAVWLAISTAVQDDLRVKRRDALVAFLTGTGTAQTPSSLSDTLLIDIEMDQCRSTSRIVQASSAIQTFVQRCLLGFESQVQITDPDGSFWGQWPWRKRYQLWVANRMIFLYPENFLSAAKRSDASPAFHKLQDSVLRNEITEDNMTDALITYLEELEQVAQLDYLALGADYVNSQPQAPNQVSVVARTRGTPPRYFYRRLDGGRWLPFEELSLGSSPTQLALRQKPDRAWLVWPTFSTYPNPNDQPPPQSTTSPPPNTTPPSNPLPVPKGLGYIRYSWVSRDRNGNWTSAKTSSRAVLFTPRNPRRQVTNISRLVGDGPLIIDGYMQDIDGQNDSELRLSSSMTLARDTVSTQDWTTVTGIPSSVKLGGEHGHEQLMTIHHDDPITNLAGPFIPWPNMIFDENRAVMPPQSSQTSALALYVQKDPAFDVDLEPLMTALNEPVYCTILPWIGLVNTNVVPPPASFNTPSPWAFLVIGSDWSFISFDSDACTALSVSVPFQSPQRRILYPAYHPYATELLAAARNSGLSVLFSAATQENPATLGKQPRVYQTAFGIQATAQLSSTQESIDFDTAAPYGLYNWETFFHTPLLVADQLRVAGRFEEAQRMYHHIFNPLSAEQTNLRARYWVTLPFRANKNIEAEDIATLLATGTLPNADPYSIIEAFPFDAHAVAEVRKTAYQKHVVMHYLDNLIAWGDSLYRTGNREDIDEATELYAFARSLLGDRPQRLRPLGVRAAKAFDDLNWLGGGNVLVPLENAIPAAVHALKAATPRASQAPLVHLPLVRADATAAPSGPQALYFCVPANDKLMSYWDILDQRLDNIRHCRSIDGAKVDLSLFAAPINPQALADAAAAGVSVEDVLAAVAAAPPPQRFRVVLQKAIELCGEVKSLGASLESALEKRDAAMLERVRSTHEGRILDRARATKEAQKSQAQGEVEALKQAKLTVQDRRDYYGGREYMSALEQAALGLSVTSAALDAAGLIVDLASSTFHALPNFTVGVAGLGGTPVGTVTEGGGNGGASLAQAGHGISRAVGLIDRVASMTATQASFTRRMDDWQFQKGQAILDLAHLDQQIAAANLRVAIADAELAGQDEQEKSWKELDRLLREKFTNEDLFTWTVGRVAEIYQQAFQQALAMARVARVAFQFERPFRVLPDLRNDYWESLRHGLFAGEALEQDLRDIEKVYLLESPFERVITQPIALSQVAPDQLMSLRLNGACRFTVSSFWLQRLDPALTHRRIRSLAVSIPCVSPPYTRVNATLRLAAGSGKAVYTSISLSHGAQDNGWDMTTRGESYVPFEGISLDNDTTWDLSFGASSDIDPLTIADVILHVELSADSGGPGTVNTPATLPFLLELPSMAQAEWTTMVGSAQHSCTISLSGLIASTLKGYQASAVANAWLVDANGKTGVNGVDYAKQLVTTIDSANNAMVLSVVAGATLPWDQLQSGAILLTMSQSHA